MSEVSASHYCCPTLPTLPPSADAGSGTGHVEDFFEMSARFGADGVITATEARVLRFMGDLVKSQIMASDLPRAVKDAMCEAIDAQVADAEAAVPREVEGAMCGSPCERGIERYCNLVREGLELASDQGLCGQAALDFAQDYARGVMTPSNGREYSGMAGTGSGSSADAAELAAERAEETANEGRSSSGRGGSSGSGAASGSGGARGEEQDLVSMAAEAMAKQHDENRTDEEGNSTGGSRSGRSGGTGGSGNWLIALAKGLAEAQDKFLSTAMNAKDKMVANAEYDSGSGSKSEFLDAQATYQAAIQMFTMLANVTATSLKSIGEGCTAIARKQ